MGDLPTCALCGLPLITAADARRLGVVACPWPGPRVRADTRDDSPPTFAEAFARFGYMSNDVATLAAWSSAAQAECAGGVCLWDTENFGQFDGLVSAIEDARVAAAEYMATFTPDQAGDAATGDTMCIQVQAVPIPDLDPASEQWATWCAEHGIDPLNSDRRGWCSDLNSYIRGATHLLYREGVLIDLYHQPEKDTS